MENQSEQQAPIAQPEKDQTLREKIKTGLLPHMRKLRALTLTALIAGAGIQEGTSIKNTAQALREEGVSVGHVMEAGLVSAGGGAVYETVDDIADTLHFSLGITDNPPKDASMTTVEEDNVTLRTLGESTLKDLAVSRKSYWENTSFLSEEQVQKARTIGPVAKVLGRSIARTLGRWNNIKNIDQPIPKGTRIIGK